MPTPADASSAPRPARRLDGLGVTLIRRVLAEAPPGALHLGLGVSNIDVPEPVREAVSRAKALRRADYGPNAGNPDLRRLIAEREGVATDQVLVTCGVQEGIALAILGTVDPGTEVAVPDPAFPVYANLARVAGATPVPYTLRAADRFRPTWDTVAPALSNNTSMVVLCSPGNPTGATATPDQWATLVGGLRDYGDDSAPVILSDEIYRELQQQAPPHPSARAHTPHAIVLGGPAKTLGLAGWRLGWAIVPDALVDPLTALHQHLVTSASTLPQEALALALKDPALDASIDRLRHHLRTRRDRAAARLEAAGWDVAAGDGAFYLWVRPPAHTDDDLATCRDLMHRAGVVTIPGSAFGPGGAGYLRLSYSVTDATLDDALDRLCNHTFAP